MTDSVVKTVAMWTTTICLTITAVSLLTVTPFSSSHSERQAVAEQNQYLESVKNQHSTYLPQLEQAKQMLADWGVETIQDHLRITTDGLALVVDLDAHAYDGNEAKYLGQIPGLTTIQLGSDREAQTAIEGFSPNNQITRLSSSEDLDLDAVIETFPKLQSLDLYLSRPKRLESVRKLGQLSDLQYINFNPIFEDVDQVLRLLSTSHGLRSISLRGSYSNAAFDVLPNFPNLETFKLDGHFRDAQLHDLIEIFQKLPLQHVLLDTKPEHRSHSLTIPDFGENSTLKSLTLFGFHGDDLSGLNNLRNLRHLRLGMRDSLDRVRRIPFDLSTLASLKFLERIEIGYASTGRCEFVRNHLPELPRFPRLKSASFRLFEDEVSNDDMQIRDADVRSLSKLPDLEVISLQGHQYITSGGLDSLTHLPRLKVLDLAKTSVDDEGMKTLTRISTLERVDVSKTLVTEDGLELLIAMPNMRNISCEGIVSQERSLEIFGILYRRQLERSKSK